MTSDRSLERAARSWLEEGPNRAPDRSVEAALTIIDSTPQERGFRVPWRLPTMNPAIRLALVAVVAILVAGVAIVGLRPTSNVAAPGIISPTPTLAPVTTARPSGDIAPLPSVLDTRTIASRFALPMKVSLPVGWKPMNDIVGSLGILNTGYPEGPNTTWWGPDLMLVENARIHDPSDAVSSEPAQFDPSRFVPWPADFIGYITALPGVRVVSGPEPVTIGGVAGTQVTVMTPPMHPLFWLDGDYTWLGGGRTGVDPAWERRYIVVKTGGHTLLVEFADDPSRFDERDAEVRAILDTITFDQRS